ncbi:sigma-54 interaction domain-containing protein [Clostridium grantii]|uniref:PAS domain S-box-containing protein n=1 Tax=Clostridium grantii DSM 8605 TaxID=1121316 RepID=A0A1M5S7Y6_9CLOT|nr:sigma 54-interacting transcriptional regulator [Clostridium grantii]SHH34752.1 PAS domain S-box-containing protein [Clostridium grantii DSM 8605]
MNNYFSSDINPDEISDIFVSMTSLLFDQLPIPINFIDVNGRIIIMNQAFLDFLGLQLEDVIGKLLTDIDPSVRLPIVVKTGKAEVGQKHKFQSGKEAIVHRIPLFYKDVIIGGAGIILIHNLGHFYSFFEEKNILKNLKKSSSNKISDLYKAKYTFDDILTHSHLGKKSKAKAESYADTDFSVLIVGESGVGKELFAHSIHSFSRRKNGPFIRINLAAMPESLIEAELFGYEKGSFTGAHSTGKMGKFELANGGTIFLDEIGEIPLYLQVKLLRLLQEKELERIGGNEIIHLDLRVICATNCNLEEKIKLKEFRQDLFYRLNVLNLKVPSLKERKTDISLLINHFITKMYQDFNIFKKFPEDVEKILTDYSWPGNVRELKNIVERMAVTASGESVKIEDIPEYILENTKKNNFYEKNNLELKETHEFGENYLKNILSDMENKLILDTLEKFNNTKVQTAKALGIPRMSLYRKLNEIQSK